MSLYFFRPEMVVGWYHSHPGFGCWLSGVDINTQQVIDLVLRLFQLVAVFNEGLLLRVLNCPGRQIVLWRNQE